MTSHPSSDVSPDDDINHAPIHATKEPLHDIKAMSEDNSMSIADGPRPSQETIDFTMSHLSLLGGSAYETCPKVLEEIHSLHVKMDSMQKMMNQVLGFLTENPILAGRMQPAQQIPVIEQIVSSPPPPPRSWRSP